MVAVRTVSPGGVEAAGAGRAAGGRSPAVMWSAQAWAASHLWGRAGAPRPRPHPGQAWRAQFVFPESLRQWAVQPEARPTGVGRVEGVLEGAFLEGDWGSASPEKASFATQTPDRHVAVRKCR